ERAVFAAKKTGGVKGFQFLAFAQVETLADVNEGGDGRIARAKSSGDNRADMRRGDGLRRRIAGVPLVLMARMQNEAEIAGGVGTNQRRAIHHAGDFFAALRQLAV